jgi:hypothetical protein
MQFQGHPSTGLLKKEKSDGSGANEPDCLVQQCWDMVDLQKEGTSKKALAAAAQLRALVAETHDKAELRKRLTEKVKAFTQALEVSCIARLILQCSALLGVNNALFGCTDFQQSSGSA